MATSLDDKEVLGRRYDECCRGDAMTEDRQSRSSFTQATADSVSRGLLATLAAVALPPLTKCAWNLLAGGKNVDSA